MASIAQRYLQSPTFPERQPRYSRDCSLLDPYKAALLAGCGWLVWRIRGGGFKGMATPGQAEQLLGLGRLRRNRALIRPDLYPKVLR